LSQVFRSILSNRIPGQVVVQITDRCNARCPQCGMRVTESFARSTLETDTIKRMIDAAACRGVQAISFTGGEPLLDLPRLVELIRYAGGAGIPFIRTGTNGFMLTNPEKKGFEDRVSRMVEQLADSPLRNFWISLDSAVDHVHDAMRGFPGVVAGIAKALPIFHQAGIYPAVNLGINRNVGGDANPIAASERIRLGPGLSGQVLLSIRKSL
jgi:MoaA/NifB/PqqE/SkfB family radical SAM enzyme